MNIRYQRKLEGRKLALVVLKNQLLGNDPATIGTVTPAVSATQAGSYVSLPFDRPPPPL